MNQVDPLYHKFLDAEIWPSLYQTLTLRTALLTRPHGISSWLRWKQEFLENDYLDNGSFRLIPLMYTNLRELGITDPIMLRLKGIHKQFWCKQQLKLTQTLKYINLLQKNRIHCVLLKGVPLSIYYYENIACRPFSDIDVYIQPSQVAKAIHILEKKGWKKDKPITQQIQQYHHDFVLRHSNCDVIEIHWNIMREHIGKPFDKEWIRRAVTFEYLGKKYYTLCPTDMLIHTIVHGMRWNIEPSIRWVADALTILNKKPDEINWDYLLNYANKNHLTLRLYLGLNYLKNEFTAKIPFTALTKLAKSSRIRYENMEAKFILRNQDYQYKNPFGELYVMFILYWRLGNYNNIFYFANGFLNYLVYRMRLRGRGELMAHVFRRLCGKISRQNLTKKEADEIY